MSELMRNAAACRRLQLGRAGIWGVVLLAGAALLSAGCSDEKPGDPIARAEASLAKRDFQAAAVELKALLSREPNSGRARQLMGELLMEQSQAAGALTEFNKALELGVDDERLHGQHAKALLANARYQELLKRYEEPRYKNPRVQAEVWTAVAVAHLRYDRVAKAEQALTTALQADPKFGWALVTKARIAASGGRSEDALSLAQQAIDTGRVNGEAWHVKGVILQRTRNDLAGAEAAFKESIKDPRFATVAQLALANLYAAQQRIPDLKELLTTLTRSKTHSPIADLVAAQIAYLESRYEAAREQLDKLLRRAPNDQELLVLSGAIDLRRGAWLQAESQLGRAVQMSEDGGAARPLLAEAYLKMGQPDKALSTLRPLVERADPHPAALAMAGDAYLLQGQFQQASAMFEQALRRRPDDPAPKTVQALSILARGRIEEAISALERIAAEDQGDVADKALISVHMRRHDFESALAAVDRLRKKQPGRADVVLHRGLVLSAKGDAAAARQSFEEVLKLQPRHYVAAANLARLDAGQGQIDAARKRLQELVVQHPNSAAARLTLADFLGVQGAPADEVKTVLADAVAALPREASLQVALVTHLLRRGDAKSALIAAQRADAAFLNNPDVLDALGRALADAGDAQQALSVFGRVASLQPQNPQPHVRLADVHARRGDLAAAARSLRRAAELAPESAEVYQRLVALVRKTRDPAPSVAIAKEIQRARPGSAHGHVLEGDILAERRNWPAAIAAFRAGLGKSDPDSRAPIRVYEALRVAGQGPAALAFVEDRLRVQPADARFLEHVAVTNIQGMRLQEAERLLKLALAADANSPVAWNNLAWVQAERGSKDALASAERALALAPTSAAVIDTVAKVLAANGQLPRALELQRQALTISRQAPDYRLHLARLLVQAGDKPAARVELDALTALGKQYPGHAAVAELRGTLDAR
ncbi:MAG: PEP-CTERM system TPR-repeat protein PrsT [Rubrivivax sp.]|nr:PEP-CTERM system TPR-repeat protein PrsT [Rubrivivax sp.]